MPPTSLPDDLAASLAAARARIAAAAARAGRGAAGVTIVAVTKTVGAEVLGPLAALGVHEVAENRVQVAEAKAPEAPPGTRWHMIGHLQTNKVRKAVRLFSAVHSVDSLRLARAIEDECARAGRTIEAFVEIHSGEEQKTGLRPAELEGFLGEVKGFAAVRWAGLMCMAPFSDNAEDARPHFRRLRELGERARGVLPGMTGLSMGMSQDFEVAVEEGATHLRLGRVLFDRLESRR